MVLRYLSEATPLYIIRLEHTLPPLQVLLLGCILAFCPGPDRAGKSMHSLGVPVCKHRCGVRGMG